MSHLYADLAIPNTVDKLFTYLVPPALSGAVKRRVRALVPFGGRTLIGFVVDVPSTKPPNVAPKPVLDVLDIEPIVSEELFYLTKWMASYYFAPWGDVLKAVLIQGIPHAGKRVVKIVEGSRQDELQKSSPESMQARILRRLLKSDSVSMVQLKKAVGTRGFYGELNKLVRLGQIAIEEKFPVHHTLPVFENIVEMTDNIRLNLRRILDEEGVKLGTRQRALIQKLVDSTRKESAIKVSELLKESGASLSSLQALERKSLLTIGKREVTQTKRDNSFDSVARMDEVRLNVQQERAVQMIRDGVEKNAFAVYLLHGVTGSGKTHVYLEAVRNVLSRGKTAIVLVPEISLTSQIVSVFRSFFGEQVVALHSRMSPGERHDAWRLLKDGKYSIVIGPRSAVFAPLDNIGLIVVDEEQEASYKQFDQSPRYHARDVAVVRARNCNAVVVLGSATPSIESYTNALSGKYTLLELPERVDGAKLPAVEIIDMAEERKKKLELRRQIRRAEAGKTTPDWKAAIAAIPLSMISDRLKEKIEDRLTKREGIILLQNRRGFSSFIECPQCGHVEMCEHCSISLTYHRTQHHLRCHYCGFTKAPADICVKCGGIDVRYRGIGTQRVEDELSKLFPQAKMLRMDLDTTTQRRSHGLILRKFSEGAADILLGTQMVAKGLDFSRVTLVGVISAETQMLLPDFRSSERTFQLLTQVAGRAGRSNLEGEVIIQTYIPQHESLRHVPAHDFKSFYEQELEHRRELEYPPFSQLTRIEFKGKIEDEVKRCANLFASLLRSRHPQGIILGPAPAVITKVKGMIRWQIVIKNRKKDDPGGQSFNRILTAARRDYQSSEVGRSKSVKVVIDVDPVGMM